MICIVYRLQIIVQNPEPLNGASWMSCIRRDRLFRSGKSDRKEIYPSISWWNDIRPRPRSFTFADVEWNLPRRSSWACVVSTRTSRPSSIGVAFVAAVHNYSRRDYLPTKEVVRAAASRGVARFDESAGLLVESVANRDQDTGTWRDQRCSIEGVLMVTLSLRWGSRRVEEGGRTPMTRLDPTRVYTCERHEGSVHERVYVCPCDCTRTRRGWGHTRAASSRAHAHHEGVVHLNRGGWYTHAAGVGWFLRRILASPVIARNEVKLTAYMPSLLRFWMPRRFARGPYALLLSAMHPMHPRLASRGKFMMAWFVFIKGRRLKIVDLTDKVDDFNFWYVLQVKFNIVFAHQVYWSFIVF